MFDNNHGFSQNVANEWMMMKLFQFAKKIKYESKSFIEIKDFRIVHHQQMDGIEFRTIGFCM